MLKKISRIAHIKGQQTALVTVPADLVKDSAFPFKVPSRVLVSIDGERLIVEKVQSDE